MTDALTEEQRRLVERLRGYSPYDRPLRPDNIFTKAAEEIEGLKARVAELEGALTPTAETKVAYIGEFQVQVPMGLDEDGRETFCYIDVPWTTIKEIMGAITAYAALNRKADQCLTNPKAN